MVQGFRKLDTTKEQMMDWRQRDGMTNREIAKKAGCSVAAVYARIGGVKQYRPRQAKPVEEAQA